MDLTNQLMVPHAGHTDAPVTQCRQRDSIRKEAEFFLPSWPGRMQVHQASGVQGVVAVIRSADYPVLSGVSRESHNSGGSPPMVGKPRAARRLQVCARPAPHLLVAPARGE